MKVAMAGLAAGEFTEGHQLDAKLIRGMPKQFIGRCLSQAQATWLLGSLDQKRA